MNTNTNLKNTTTSNTSKNEDILPKIKTPSVYYPLLLILILVIIIIFFLLFQINISSTKSDGSSQKAVGDIFIILFFTLIILGICFTLLPNFKEFSTLFTQISNVTYVILYTIFLILFFTLTSSDTINEYAYIITPVTMLFGIFMFSKSFSTNYVENFNINYERIKSLILFFCLITIFIIYYDTDPGGYIQEYFGYSLLLTIVISVFAMLYLIVILTLPDITREIKGEDKSSNFLKNFTPFLTYNTIGFFVFLIIVTFGIVAYPGGFLNDKPNSAAIMILLLISFIIWSVIIGSSLFTDVMDKQVTTTDTSLIKRGLLVLFGLIISCLIIFWIVYGVQNLSTNTGTTSFVLNILLVILILGLINKTINVKLPGGNAKKNAFFTLLTNTLFYIPCLFSSIFDFIGKTISGEQDGTTMGSILMIIITVILFIIYFNTPSLVNKIYLQGGNQLLNDPVYTDTEYSLGTYEELNGSDDFNYKFALSFWVYIDSAPPNTNPSYTKYTSLLNFGGKPNVLYNGQTNTLMVTMEQADTESKLTEFDEKNNRILYKNNNILLQKWNNIIINYDGGILDIFLNGELVKSNVGVVPYYKLDNLTIGENNGIKGGICNVIYYKHVLSSNNIYYLYNTIKNKTPPIVNETKQLLPKKSDINYSYQPET